MQHFYTSIHTTIVALFVICMPLNGMNENLFLTMALINPKQLDYILPLQKIETSVLSNFQILDPHKKNQETRKICIKNIDTLEKYITETDSYIDLNNSKRLKDIQTLRETLENQQSYNQAIKNKEYIKWPTIIKAISDITINNYYRIAQGYIPQDSGFQFEQSKNNSLKWTDTPENQPENQLADQVEYIQAQKWNIIHETFLLQLLWSKEKDFNRRSFFYEALYSIKQNCPVVTYPRGNKTGKIIKT